MDLQLQEVNWQTENTYMGSEIPTTLARHLGLKQETWNLCVVGHVLYIGNLSAVPYFRNGTNIEHTAFTRPLVPKYAIIRV